MKTCPKCGGVKPLGAFNLRPNGKPHSYCKTCKNTLTVAWAKANKDKQRAAVDKYQAANRGKVKAMAKAYYTENVEKARAACTAWREANRETHREAASNWRAANPDKARAQEARRRAAKVNAVPAWADRDATREVYRAAASLRKQGTDVHVDHIIPLRGANVCGLHVHYNLQVLPAAANLSKGNRL